MGASLSQSKPAKPQLKLDWCSHEAAKYACEHWHYSGCIPKSKILKIGVWENDQFIGCVLFGRGVSANIGTPYGLGMTECCELLRIALHNHINPVSRIVSIAIKLLKKQSPGVRLIISFADTSRHIGAVYQAMNWFYIGDVKPKTRYIHGGKVLHDRAVIARYGSTSRIPSTYVKTFSGVKHRYAYPLDEEMRTQILPLAKPYPKKPRATSIESDASSVPTGRGNCNVIVALHTTEEAAK